MEKRAASAERDDPCARFEAAAEGYLRALGRGPWRYPAWRDGVRRADRILAVVIGRGAAVSAAAGAVADLAARLTEKGVAVDLAARTVALDLAQRTLSYTGHDGDLDRVRTVRLLVRDLAERQGVPADGSAGGGSAQLVASVDLRAIAYVREFQKRAGADKLPSHAEVASAIKCNVDTLSGRDRKGGWRCPAYMRLVQSCRADPSRPDAPRSGRKSGEVAAERARQR